MVNTADTLFIMLSTALVMLMTPGLDIRSAKISTKVDQVVDVFYVRDLYGQKIYHPEQCEEIQKALLFKLEGDKRTG